jgi:PPOX class probable F420-dependent enzyme
LGKINREVFELATAANYAILTTLAAGGFPTASLMWVDADENHVLINTEQHRVKYRNISNDPRVNILIVDRNDMGHYAEVQGIVIERLLGTAAREHIDKLSEKYLGHPFDPRLITSQRVLFKIRPVKQRIRRGEAIGE